MATRRRKGTGMVRVKGTLCRNKKGQFSRCQKGKISSGKGKGFRKKHAKSKLKGRCVKWSKGRTRCLRRTKR